MEKKFQAKSVSSATGLEVFYFLDNPLNITTDIKKRTIMVNQASYCLKEILCSKYLSRYIKYAPHMKLSRSIFPMEVKAGP
jgi:hypothetical protein